MLDPMAIVTGGFQGSRTANHYTFRILTAGFIWGASRYPAQRKYDATGLTETGANKPLTPVVRVGDRNTSIAVREVFRKQ